MSSVIIAGNTSGTITVAAPAAAGTNTITMPAATGTMALTSDITTEIPSQSGNSGKFLTTNGSAASWGTVASGGMTLLATLNTTSGETITAPSLNLTGFKFVLITTLQVSHSSSTSQGLRFTPNTGGSYGLGSYDIPSSFKWSSVSNIELATGSYTAFLPNNMPVPSQPLGFLSAGLGNNNAFTSSVTSIDFTWSAGGTFDAGSIRVYGVA